MKSLPWRPLPAWSLNIEIKSFPESPEYTPPPMEFARLVLERIREYKLEARAIVQSFDFRTLRAMRDLAPEIRRSALTEDDPRDFVTIAREAADTQMVSPHYHLVTPEKVAQAHGAGLQVMAWTVNTPRDWARMAARASGRHHHRRSGCLDRISYGTGVPLKANNRACAGATRAAASVSPST